MSFLIDGREDAVPTILFVHDVGVPMKPVAMSPVADALREVGFRAARFELTDMVACRGGVRTPAPKTRRLVGYAEAVAALACDCPMFNGGKSMEGRVASIGRTSMMQRWSIAGLLCLDYPRPETYRHMPRIFALRSTRISGCGARPFEPCDGGGHEVRAKRSSMGSVMKRVREA
jgi:predicted alpha/beta-hydrolase family hydrolase